MADLPYQNKIVSGPQIKYSFQTVSARFGYNYMQNAALGPVNTSVETSITIAPLTDTELAVLRNFILNIGIEGLFDVNINGLSAQVRYKPNSYKETILSKDRLTGEYLTQVTLDLQEYKA